MNKKKVFNQKLFIDQLGVCISKNNYEESLQKLRELCINSPFNTQAFIQVFIRAWCEKIINMLPRISKMKSGTFYDLRQK